MDLVGVIMEKYRDYHCDFIVIDKTGIGQGVWDRLKELDYPVRGVSFGEKSEDDQYQNLKSEWHFRQRKWLLSGGRLVHNSAWNEFEYVKYKNKDGKIIIQPKEDLFREGIASPNVVDAAVLTMVVTDQSIKTQKALIANRGRPFADSTIEIWNNGEQSID